jgi:hypothetical protein
MNRLLKEMSRHLVVYFMITVVPMAAHANEVEVKVKNFPDTQRIKGSVSIDGTVRHAKSFKVEGVLVSSSKRNEITELIPAGIVETDGFTSISVSLQGEIKSSNFIPGAIGVLLIPDEEPILHALREAKQVQFPIETICNIKSGDSEYFSSPQSSNRVAFPRYRVYLYDTLNRPAEANVYLYLTN